MALNSRENTFKVDLVNFSRRPSYEQIHHFVNRVLGLQPNQVKRLQINHALKCAHVKCVDLATAETVVKEHDGRHELEVEGKKCGFRLLIDSGYTEVKVHDLSESVTNEDIAAFLCRYGDVHDVKELSWGPSFAYQNISSGVRVAVMTLRSHIRSFVTVHGQETLITYRNQPASCKHCSQPQHPGKLKQTTAIVGPYEKITTHNHVSELNELNASTTSQSNVMESKPTKKPPKEAATTAGNGKKRKQQQQQSVRPAVRVPTSDPL